MISHDVTTWTQNMLPMLERRLRTLKTREAGPLGSETTLLSLPTYISVCRYVAVSQNCTK